MLKKFLTVIYIILFLLLIYILQMVVIDGRDLFGAKPNLILISVIVVSLWYGLYTGSIYGFLIGVISDIIFGNTFGGYTICYSLVGIIIGLINGSYRKESKMSLVYVTMIATSVFEVVQYIEYLFLTGVGSNIFYLLRQIILSILLNIIIVYIVYGGVYKIVGYFDSNLRKEDSI